MIEFFQITGSSSFAVRCALEEIGVEYRAIDVVPFDRGQTPELEALNPWRTVPALRDGEAEVHEIGACLMYLAERFPEAGLAPAIGDPARGAYLRWLVWLADTFRPLWERIMAPRFFTTESEPGVRAKGLADLERVGEYLEAQLAGRTWCLGEQYSVADIYLYMLVGWQHYKPGLPDRGRGRAGALLARRCAARDRPGARTRRPRRAADPPPPGAARRQARRRPEGHVRLSRPAGR